MIKITIFVVRKASLTFEEFDTYWREKHAPLIKSVKDFSRHVRKYVQSHRASSDVPFAQQGDYDGVAELWFDSVESLNTAFAEPKYMELIRPDELKFVDLDRCVSIVCEEFQVI
ncbi:MAG: EthD domain-containing protein [Proteobacteria bacterium]|nr:EthD domain-containing protein [Pseudomonadota bacterium]